jgi:hypothetical protein
LKQTRRDPAQGPPESAPTLINTARDGSEQTMSRFGAWIVWTGLIFLASAASAQMLAPYDAGRAPYRAGSDFDQPYAGPPPIAIRGVPRPPLPIPHAESRVVPLPAPKPATTGNSPEATPQSAADARTGTEMGTTPSAQVSATTGEAKRDAKPKPPAPQILPTREMPKVQALE